MRNLKIFNILMLVVVLSACGGGLVGDVDESHPTQQAPQGQPNFVLEYNDKNQLIVNWDHQSDVQTYTLYLSTSETFEASETTLISLDQPPYVVKPENTGQQYYVKLKSSWFGNESVESQQQTFIAPPFVPNELVSIVTEDNTIKLDWASVDGAEGYTVYRHTSDTLDLNSAVITENVSPPYVDNSLMPNQDYFYWLVATTNDQSSAFSIVSSAKTSVVVEENLPPVFNSDNVFDVNENNLVISTILADDDLSENLNFNIVGGDDANLFSLNDSSGELAFNNAPDYETPGDSDSDNIYQLEIEVSDGEKTAQQHIEITVLDLDDTLPIIPETPPIINFTLDTIDALEAAGSIILSVILDKANMQSSITLEVNTLAGTASTNDYLAMTNQQLVIPAGDTQQNIEIKIIDDEIYEGSTSESFNVALSNVNGATLGNLNSVVININDNDPQPTTQPTANAGLDRSVAVNTLVTLDGTASKTFNNSGSLNYLWTPPAGISLSAIGVVQPTFTLPAGSKAGTIFTFSLVVSNSEGVNSEPDSVDFIVVNSNPIANAGLDHSARVGDVVTLDASGSTDPNNDSLSYSWSAPAGISLSSSESLQPTFTVNAGTNAGTSFIFNLIVSDNQGGSNSDEVKISIFDSIPTAHAGPDQNARVGDLITLDASGSTDPNNDELKYLWSPPVGISLSNTDVVNPSFTVPNGTKTGSTLTFNLTASDNQGSSNTDSIKISILNSAPTANAGTNQNSHVGDTVTLDASNSTDPNDDTLSYLWSSADGISLSDNTAQQPAFTVPSATKGGSTLQFNLTVNDNQGGSSTDRIDVTVLNSAPIANAGPDQNVSVGEIVTLTASTSIDSNNDTLSYLWTAPAGISLSDTQAEQPSFTVPSGTKRGAALEFNLTVSDNQGGSSTDSVKITVLNTPPVADAGPDQSASVGDVIILTAAGSSDPNDDSLSYAWSAPTGINLSNNKSQQPFFTMPTGSKNSSSLQFDLTVSDNQGGSSTDSIKVNILNTPPTANAGPDQSARVKDVVTLTASDSTDPNTDNLSYMWSAPLGISLSSNTAIQPSFTIASGIKAGETIDFDLTVNDGFGGTNTDSVTINILNTSPRADAGTDQSVNVDDVVTLDASGSSDPNNDSLSFIWSAPAGFTLSNSNAAQTTFIAPPMSSTASPFTFNLTVNDGQGGSSIDNVNITILSSDPIADAGVDQNVSVSDVVTLDASGSSDPNNADLNYSWLAPDSISLSDPNTMQPTYTVAQGTKAGLLFIFKLVVTNNQGGSSSDEVAISILNSPPIANSGPNKSTVIGSLVTFDGSASSDANGDNLTYNWSILSSPSGSSATLASSTSNQPTFTPDVLGDYTFQLSVDDGIASDIDTLQLNAISFNTPEMVPITGGTFQMGDETSIDGTTKGSGAISELPVHSVTITDFEIGKYEVTFSEYDQYLVNRTNNPITDPSTISSGEAWDSAGFGRASRPVVMVSWDDIQSYLAWLNEQLGYALDDPNRYRLPTEAEWEFAARAGQITTFNSGDCINTDQANYNGESDYAYTKSNGESVNCPATNIYRRQSEPVGSFAANQYGLYDMHGNVREFTEDRCHENYIGAPNDGSAWLERIGLCSNSRSVRGGAWNNSISYLRSAARLGNQPYQRYGSFGFRLARTP